MKLMLAENIRMFRKQRKLTQEKLAEALGCEARRVTSREEFEAAFAEALECKIPFVIDCIIDSDDKVWPMVAPGAPINEAFDENDI